MSHVMAVFDRLQYRSSLPGEPWDVMWSHGYPYNVFKEDLQHLLPHQKARTMDAHVYTLQWTYTSLWTYTILWTYIHNDQWMLQSITQIYTICTSYHVLIHFSIHTHSTKCLVTFNITQTHNYMYIFSRHLCI